MPTSQRQDALPAGTDAPESQASPRPRPARGPRGCCATCHQQQARVIALLEVMVLRGMPSFHQGLTPAAYLHQLYEAAARREAALEVHGSP